MAPVSMPFPKENLDRCRERVLHALSKALPADVIVSAEAELIAYECDALSAYTCPPLCVVLPTDTAQVSTVMTLCAQCGVPVVPRGSGTSLTGGALPTADSVVLGTSRLNQVLEIDTANRFIRVQAGVTNTNVSVAVRELGFFYAPDPSSQLACTIAGNIATNSGGAHCLKYGVTTNNLLGATVVLTSGEILQLGGTTTQAQHLDLLGILCGSEGQLGIVTEATLRILPTPEGARPALIGFDSPETAGQCVANIVKAGVLPVAIEYMDRLCVRATEAHAQAGYPDVEALLIVEVEGSENDIQEQLQALRSIAEELHPVEFRVSNNAVEAEAIWKGRKSAFGAVGALGDYLCLDGVVPVSRLPELLVTIGELAESYDLQVTNVFHAGDGNIHPLIVFDAHRQGELEKAEALGADILRACVAVGGCLTGEHGVGVEKRELMEEQFSADDLTLQMSIKDVFDPQWMLNPAKVFPLHLSESRRNKLEPWAQGLAPPVSASKVTPNHVEHGS